MELPIRPATEDELPLILRAMGNAFGGDPEPREEPHVHALMEYDRTRCAFDGAEMIGTLGSYSFDLAVPGGNTLATAGTTLVSVLTTHRRRGVLRAMMASHLRDAHERGEPLAVLWASESSIYGRFGYGAAVKQTDIVVETRHAGFRAPVDAPGGCRLVEKDEAARLLPALYEDLWRSRPGHFARTHAWWEHRLLLDPEWLRGGASASRWVVYEEAGLARGYACYQIVQRWENSGLPGSELRLLALYAHDAHGRAALWRHALDVDLVVKLRAANQPPDCELPWLLADSRRAQQQVRDSLWVRIIDVKAALEARSYPATGGLILELHDEFRPETSATWSLDAGPEGAKCEPSTRTPEIRLAISELGSVYLGGHGLGALSRAGLVEGSAEAIGRANELFGWDPSPWCPEIF